MTLGRTSSGSIKIKTDEAGGGLRAVECACCGGCEDNPYDLSNYPEATQAEFENWQKGGIANISMSFNQYGESYSDSAALQIPPNFCGAFEWSSFVDACYWDALGIQYFRGVSLSFGIIKTVHWGYRVVAGGSGFGAITIPQGDGTNECVGHGSGIGPYDYGCGGTLIFNKMFYYSNCYGSLSVSFNFMPN